MTEARAKVLKEIYKTRYLIGELTDYEYRRHIERIEEQETFKWPLERK